MNRRFAHSFPFSFTALCVFHGFSERDKQFQSARQSPVWFLVQLRYTVAHADLPCHSLHRFASYSATRSFVIKMGRQFLLPVSDLVPGQ